MESVEERLISPSQVEVDTGDGSIFVRARLIGVDMSDGGPSVNGVELITGREIEEAEFGEPVVLIERNFGVYYELPDEGELRLGGDVAARYVGHAVSPEYFLIVEDGGFFGQANLAVIFTSIETAQKLSGRQGQVNDLVLTVEPGADLAAVETALVAETAERHADTGLDLMRTEDDASYLALTRDPEGDQQFYNVFALILFAGAAFASLNFSARMVETQRREIGTSMALGENPVAIAARPLLVGVQIALLGVVFGIGVGLLIAMLMQGVLESFVPLPVFITPFQTGIFAGVAAIGFLLPILAVLWPVFRAVRVQPVDAIRTGHLAARGGGLAPAISRLPLPGSSLGRMPFRNLMRAPRRTFLTLFALTAVLAILVSVVGITDSLLATLARGDEELLRGVPDRLIVRLDSFYSVDSPEVNGIISGGSLGVAEPGIVLGGSVQGSGESITVAVQYVDLEGGAWRPTVLEGTLSDGRPGIVLARKAAKDLGVGAGDSVTLTLPVRTGPDSFTLGASAVPVLAVHPHPLRFNAYMDIRHAGQVGLEGFANVVTGAPAPGETRERRQAGPVRLARRRDRTGDSRDFPGGPGSIRSVHEHLHRDADIRAGPRAADRFQHREHQLRRAPARPRHDVRLRHTRAEGDRQLGHGRPGSRRTRLYTGHRSRLCPAPLDDPCVGPRQLSRHGHHTHDKHTRDGRLPWGSHRGRRLGARAHRAQAPADERPKHAASARISCSFRPEQGRRDNLRR